MQNFCNAILEKLNPDSEPSYESYLNPPKQNLSRTASTRRVLSSTASSNSNMMQPQYYQQRVNPIRGQNPPYKAVIYKAYSPITKLDDLR